MRKYINIRYFFLLIILSVASVASANLSLSIKADLDSVNLEMGRTTPIHIEIIQPRETEGVLLAKPESYIAPMVEVSSITEADTTDIGNGLLQIRRDIIVQSFDSGDYVIPEIVFLVGNDSIKSNKLALRVTPVDVSHMETINPDADIQPGNSKWYDFLPAFIVDYWEWILIALILIGGGLYAYFKLRKKDLRMPFKAPAPKLSPYEIAVKSLTDLKEKNLCASGQEKEYYTRLTDILRIYLHERFDINAMEMTSSQIVKVLNSREETRLPNRLMKQILEIADFVKFAKVRPLPEDNVKSFNSAMQFVEDTKPAEPANSVEDNTSDNQTNFKETTNKL